eukprot:CAMPEP_0174697614 /NCGR_PEP_ID=MMETSP1094-20130205/3427_1 /TAXON_ID=156173 /ORGANISM="Chrysochromulina brevifilum, Strain UTEX LB 985" /LENGTH=346 /DNA_ID=CAMNT_0015894623 /DNA_START=65 /DNA_END=1105 /DNA_ORIENTATION=+
MNDRMAELRNSGFSGMPVSQGVPAGDVEMGKTSAASGYMQLFFDEVEGIKTTMRSIKTFMNQMEQLHGEALSAISAEQERELAAKLEDLMKTTNGHATQVRNKLKALDVENKEFANANKGSSEARIRTNMHGTLTRKFVDLMKDYQELQTKHKNKYRDRVKRQFKIVKPQATEQEIEAAADDPKAPEIFSQQILQGPGHAAARNALADIQERHKDITRLETSIAELHQLFLDMSVLVESQGELLDQIEYTVSQSVNYTGKAVEELRSANKYQKKVRAKMCCVIVTVIVILIVILVPLLINRKDDSRRRLTSEHLHFEPTIVLAAAGQSVERVVEPLLAPLMLHAHT